MKKANLHSTYASRTMLWSGPIIAAFVIFHLLHLTFGTVHPGGPFDEQNVFNNIVTGFQVWPIAFYIIAMIMLCYHLYHAVEYVPDARRQPSRVHALAEATREAFRHPDRRRQYFDSCRRSGRLHQACLGSNSMELKSNVPTGPIGSGKTQVRAQAGNPANKRKSNVVGSGLAGVLQLPAWATRLQRSMLLLSR